MKAELVVINRTEKNPAWEVKSTFHTEREAAFEAIRANKGVSKHVGAGGRGNKYAVRVNGIIVDAEYEWGQEYSESLRK